MDEYPGLMLWTDSYLSDTTHLTTQEHGAYLLLMMAAWRTPSCSLPDNDRRLARMAGVGIVRWRSLRPVMEELWDIENGSWTQKRLLFERKKANALREQKVRAGRASALKRQQTGSTGVAPDDPTAGQPTTTLLHSTPKKERTVAKATGAGAPNLELQILPNSDFRKLLFSEGLNWLADRQGKPPERLRSTLGRWLQLTGDDAEAVYLLLVQAQSFEGNGAADAVSWIEARLKPRPKGESDAERKRNETLAAIFKA